MISRIASCSLAFLVALGAGTSVAAAQGDDVETKMEETLARAQKTAGFDYTFLMNRLCLFPTINGSPSTEDKVPGYVSDPSSAPARDTWYAEPHQVFDDLYWVGGQIQSAWVLKTSEGLILIDTIYPYNSRELVLDGMTRLGLDPKDIKYIVISHGHGDHIGGVEMAQKVSGAKVVMGKADWDLVTKFPNRYKTMMPDRSNGIEVSEAMDLTLGDHTIHLTPTPGHTPGTLSSIFDVHDYGRPVTVAYSGGTAFNFQMDKASAAIPHLEEYVKGNSAFGEKAVDAGATVLISNHSSFDHAYDKSRMMAGRGFGENPFVSTTDDVKRYFSIMTDCADYQIMKFKADGTGN